MRLAMIAQLLSWLNRVDESGTMNNDYAWCPMLEYQRTFGVVDTDGAGWNEQGDQLLQRFRFAVPGQMATRRSCPGGFRVNSWLVGVPSIVRRNVARICNRWFNEAALGFGARVVAGGLLLEAPEVGRWPSPVASKRTLTSPAVCAVMAPLR